MRALRSLARSKIVSANCTGYFVTDPKGKEYRVIGCARHSETEEEFVVYQALYGIQELWIRPKDMFMEQVSKEGILGLERKKLGHFAPIFRPSLTAPQSKKPQHSYSMPRFFLNRSVQI